MPIVDNNLSSLVQSLKANPLLWGKFYLPHHFRLATPPFHLHLLQQALNHRFLAVAAPRASAKSTILSFLYPLHSLCFSTHHFIVIVSNTYKKAAGALDNLKREFADNRLLKDHFFITPTRDAEGDSVFRHRTGFEARVLCKGAEQIGAIRGEKFGAYRPDLIIVDDLEDDELVRNPERRIELKNLYDEALIPAGEVSNVKVLVIGTILHDDSLMAKLVSPDFYPEYHKIFFQARFEKEGKRFSLWPQKWSVEDLDELERQKPEVFAKEYQNDPVSGLSSKFSKDDFRYWKIENLQYILFGSEGEIVSKGELSDCKPAIACDLAWEEKRESDYSVILPGFLTPTNDILVDDYIFKKGMRPNEIEDILFQMEQRLRAITGTVVPIGFEKAKIEKVVKWFLTQAMRRRNHYLLIKDLMWDTDKIQRIVTKLQPRYVQHVIYHKRGMGDLEGQLLRVPSGTHDDLPDALQGLTQLLEFPRFLKKAVTSDTAFEWWRNKAIERNNPIKKTFQFGVRGRKVVTIPYQEAFS